MSNQTVKIGDWYLYFDSADYDAENDVLHLTVGKPRAGHGEETPDGHIARFDGTGRFCEVTLVGLRAKLDKGEWVAVTLPF